MRLCAYVVVHDTGFAPNPFGDDCTLAACTPNHMGRPCSPETGWSGTTKAAGLRLLHAMRVS